MIFKVLLIIMLVLPLGVVATVLLGNLVDEVISKGKKKTGRHKK